MNIPKGAILFDLETDGLLPELTQVHCAAWQVYGETTVHSCRGVEALLPLLASAPMVIGHNIMAFDIPAIQKLYPTFTITGMVLDTLLCTRLIWPEVKQQDFIEYRRDKSFIPTKLIGSHSLEAWGYRLKVLKEQYTGGWEQWSPEMQHYNEQDVVVTAALFNLIVSKDYSETAIQLEHDFARCLVEMENRGFSFDEEKAVALYSELVAERETLRGKLQEVFPPWEETETFIPKVNNKARGYVKGEPFTKRWMVTFNPASHEHIAKRLIVQRDWKPKEFTDTGDPKTDEHTLAQLAPDWEECALLVRYLEVNKIIGMLAEGDNAWLKLSKNGRIHGRVIGNGTVTGRCAHHTPNLGQIPKKGDLGKRCRALFRATPGLRLVGADASGLELRALAHYMALYDGGAYAKVVTEGDVHTFNQQAAGLPTRDNAKTFIYGWLYGAGDAKIGKIVGKGMAEGKKLRLAFLRRIPAVSRLKNAVAESVQKRGYLFGLDKRKLHIRSSHSALNTLLQSCGAILVKRATVILHEELRKRGYLGTSVWMVAHVHDEMQLEVQPGMEETIGQLAVQSIQLAGESFGLRCSLTGEHKAGENWKETH